MNIKKLEEKRGKLNQKMNKVLACQNKEIEKIEKEIEKIDEEITGIKVGDRVKISSVLVRDIYKKSDLEILGKTGIAIEIRGKWCDIDVENRGRCIVGINNLEKV